MKRRADSRPPDGEGERRQIVARALGDHEVRARRTPRRASASRVPSRSNDAPEMSTTSTSPTIATTEPAQHERRRRATGAHPRRIHQQHRREVLDEQRDGDRHPLHRGEEEDLAPSHRR